MGRVLREEIQERKKEEERKGKGVFKEGMQERKKEF